MTFRADVIAKYKAVFAGRLYFDTSPEGWTPEQMVAPFCIINQVGGEERRYIDNTLHEFGNADLQFFTWGARLDEVDAAMRALSAAIAASSTDTFVTISYGAATSDYNDILKLRGLRQTFGFWYKNQ